MMKRNILAVVIPALLAAGAANAAEIYNKDGNKLDLYGKVDARHTFSDNAGDDGDATYVRFGFKGETQINDQLTGYGQWEYNVQANHTEGGADVQDGNKTRLGFAGLKFGDAGSFDYGRNYGVIYDAMSYTDQLPVFGDDTLYQDNDNFLIGRSSGVATYRNSNFFGLVDGLKFALQYQGKNDAGGANDRTSVARQNGDGYGGSLVYALGDSGVSISGAYTSSDRTNNQQAQAYGHGDKADSWGTGLKYDANNLYLAAIYSETRNMTPISGTSTVTGSSVSGMANKTQNVELLAQYQFDFGLRPSLGYIQTKGKDIENGIGDEDLVKYIDVGATYYFNKNMNAYVDYKINQLKDDNKLALNTDDVVAVGLVYQF